MTCACVENAEGTTIERPCLEHARWAKTHAAQTWGDAAPAPLSETQRAVVAARRRSAGR